MSAAGEDLEGLARTFLYDEVTVGEGNLKWVALRACFVEWLVHEGADGDPLTLQAHWLSRACEEAGFLLSGKASRRVERARLYVGTPAEFLADMAEFTTAS